MKYRSDVDGLRAIAVVPVILSHTQINAFSGGFIGVDIFFVISGFLITRILIDEMTTGTYTLSGFYERRARRILPALLMVILVTFPFAWYLMLPDFLQNFGQSVVATLLFSNNLLLAMTSGYWDLESGFKPLLHTWSLGVEEQFYIIFPLLLALIWRLGRRWQLIVIGVLWVLSLALAQWGLGWNPAKSFYLPTSRAWELLTGCAAAYVSREPRRGGAAVALAGFIGLIVAYIMFDKSTPSPSIYMLLPVLCTAAILVFNQPGSICWRILSLRPLVAIGLVSYSAYLWHQPIFALTRVALVNEPSGAVMLCLGAVSLGLAWLSWRFVETPFRRASVVPFRTFAAPTATLSAALIGAGVYLHMAQGLPERLYPGLEARADMYISYNERIRALSAPAFPDDVKVKTLVIGNSFGRDVANALLETGKVSERSLVYRDFGPLNAFPRQLSAEELGLLTAANVVILTIQGGEAEHIVFAARVLSEQTKAHVIVFGPKSFGDNLNPYGRTRIENRPDLLSPVPSDVVSLNEALISKFPRNIYVDLLRIFGPDGNNVHIFDNKGYMLTPDRIHLTKFGAEFLASKIVKIRPDIISLLN